MYLIGILRKQRQTGRIQGDIQRVHQHRLEYWGNVNTWTGGGAGNKTQVSRTTRGQSKDQNNSRLTWTR